MNDNELTQALLNAGLIEDNEMQLHPPILFEVLTPAHAIEAISDYVGKRFYVLDGRVFIGLSA